MYLSFNLKKAAKLFCVFIIAAVLLMGLISLSYDAAATLGKWKGERLPSLKCETEEERQELLNELGWEIKEVYSKQTVMIPEEFDETYFKYNELQKKQGLNLSRHKGKRALKYTYIIENYPGEAKDVRLTLLIRRGKLIGGDVCSLGREGFMRTLLYPETSGISEVAK